MCFRWDIDTLIAKVPGLGGVIDLTNTAKYYDPSVSIYEQ